MEIVGVIPAAGYAARLQPLDGSKEVLPVGGRPVMDYLVDRMRAGGCTRTRIVTRPEKTDVIAHCGKLGVEVVLATPATVSDSFRFGMDDLGDDDIVLLGFPDTLWEPQDGYRPLVEAVQQGREVALGLFRIPASERLRSDVVVVDREGVVVDVAVKPAAPRSDWIWGCAAARMSAMAELSGTEWPGDYFALLCREGRDMHGVPLSDVWLDVGTKGALREADEWWAARARA